LASAATAGLIADHDLVDLGEHDLKGFDTAERIFQVGRGEFPALRSRRAIVGNLPVELSTFVGRSHELDSLVATLTDHRLVTLIGVGGTGKTRLALETAALVNGSFPDGCWMAALAQVAIAEAVPFALATGFGVTAPPEGDVIEHLVERFRHKRALIMVDNCEHVLAAAADAVERIVTGCRGVAVLATSREPLMVRGERLFPVPPLPPDEAEWLFIERARDEAPELEIDVHQATAVTELCRRLDGLPLALELAASRVRALTPVELVVNLEERFRLLVGGRRSNMERHQTMRGTLDWSYHMCSEPERAVFDRLSVFPADFDLAAARAVAADDDVDGRDVVDIVVHLVDRSLLQRTTAADGTARYRMLETMRAYGREHLQHDGVADDVRARHARHTADTVAALSLRTVGPDEREVALRLNRLLPDALVAFDWFLDRDDWRDALVLTFVGTHLSERESGEMASRLHEAARAADVDPLLLDEIERGDPRVEGSRPASELVERGWRNLRALAPVPTDRYAHPPHGDFGDGDLGADDIDEFVSSLSRWSSAPPVNNYVAQRHAIRALVSDGFLDRAETLLGDFSTFVGNLDSELARRELAELRGVAATQRQDWTAAVGWYREAVGDGGLRTWFDLTSAWSLILARALADEPFAPTGGELREPWECYLREHMYVLRWRGATSTALALHRLGHGELADRFVAWAHRNDSVGAMGRHFNGLLEAAGLPTRVVDEAIDLDTLLADLFAIADELDGGAA
jgi:predicted ATPase